MSLYVSGSRQRFAALVVLLLSATAQATPSSVKQDLPQLRAQAEAFLLAQATALPGRARVSVSDPDTRLQLSTCESLHWSLAPGARLLGKTTVLAQCSAPVVWSVYLQATVSVFSLYVSAARPLAQGQRPGEADLMLKEADLASLPAGVLTDIALAQQSSLRVPVSAGMPVTQAMLRREPLIQPGQTVRLVAKGQGFAISTEARALTAGAEGELVRARTAGGQVVSGVAQADGAVCLHY